MIMTCLISLAPRVGVPEDQVAWFLLAGLDAGAVAGGQAMRVQVMAALPREHLVAI